MCSKPHRRKMESVLAGVMLVIGDYALRTCLGGVLSPLPFFFLLSNIVNCS